MKFAGAQIEQNLNSYKFRTKMFTSLDKVFTACDLRHCSNTVFVCVVLRRETRDERLKETKSEDVYSQVHAKMVHKNRTASDVKYSV